VLQKASIVRGQVIDDETHRPVPGARVTMQGLGHVGERFVPPGSGRESHGRTVTTDLEGRYQFRSLGPGAFTLYFRGGPGGVASASIDRASVGSRETLEVPPVRLAKGANVTIRLIDNEMNRLVYMKADETVVIGIRSADGGAEAAKPRLETLHMQVDGTIGVWLPAGKHALSLSGGPYFSIGDVPEGMGHDVREVEIKGGEEPTVVFRVVRIARGEAVSQATPVAVTKSAKLKEDVRNATLLLNVDMSELQKAIEANRQHPNTVPDSEIQKLRLTTMRNRLKRDLLEAELKLPPLP